ncbi:MAG TPA: hypothetical protein VD833_21555 [Vicinamibacterales bacterium]|nr:hypothetical protein [Vicinamibacterales bacterium]
MDSTRSQVLVTSAVVAVAVVVLTMWSDRTAASPAEASRGQLVWGTWVLALDATPFGIPGGFLPGVFTFHRDGTFTGTDGGDLGSFPFTTTDTAQHGVWVQAGGQIRGTSLFLRKDEATGQLEGWHRGRFTLQLSGAGDLLSGFAEEEVLACDPTGPTPFTLLNCPDPITGMFSPSPFPIPIQFRRLRIVP